MSESNGGRTSRDLMKNMIAKAHGVEPPPIKRNEHMQMNEQASQQYIESRIQSDPWASDAPRPVVRNVQERDKTRNIIKNGLMRQAKGEVPSPHMPEKLRKMVTKPAPAAVAQAPQKISNIDATPTFSYGGRTPGLPTGGGGIEGTPMFNYQAAVIPQQHIQEEVYEETDYEEALPPRKKTMFHTKRRKRRIQESVAGIYETLRNLAEALEESAGGEISVFAVDEAENVQTVELIHKSEDGKLMKIECMDAGSLSTATVTVTTEDEAIFRQSVSRRYTSGDAMVEDLANLLDAAARIL